MSIALDYAEFSRKAVKSDISVRDLVEAAFYAGAEAVISATDESYEKSRSVYGALDNARREVDRYKKREEDDQA